MPHIIAIKPNFIERDKYSLHLIEVHYNEMENRCMVAQHESHHNVTVNHAVIASSSLMKYIFCASRPSDFLSISQYYDDMLA